MIGRLGKLKLCYNHTFFNISRSFNKKSTCFQNKRQRDSKRNLLDHPTPEYTVVFPLIRFLSLLPSHFVLCSKVGVSLKISFPLSQTVLTNQRPVVGVGGGGRGGVDKEFPFLSPKYAVNKPSHQVHVNCSCTCCDLNLGLFQIVSSNFDFYSLCYPLQFLTCLLPELYNYL